MYRTRFTAWWRGNITGPVEVVRAVREKVGLGADWIHLRATGAAAGQFDANTELMSLEEMEAAAKTAHNFGLRVTCNACGAAVSRRRCKQAS